MQSPPAAWIGLVKYIKMNKALPAIVIDFSNFFVLCTNLHILDTSKEWLIFPAKKRICIYNVFVINKTEKSFSLIG